MSEAPDQLRDPPPSGRTRKGWRGRLWIYVVLLAAGVAATLAHFDTSPESRLANLLAAVDASAGKERVFHDDGGFLAVFPQRGYVLTLFVGDSEGFGLADYMTLRRMDDEVVVELMIPTSEGEGGETRLKGAEIEAFLQRVGISRGGVERTLERNYAPAATTPGG